MIRRIKDRILRWRADRSLSMRRERLRRRARSRIGSVENPLGSSLTADEKRAVMDFWGRYYPASTDFHDYYKRATGIFRVDYVPDDFHFHHIDTYFNDWSRAKYIDNKTLYPLLFPDVRQARMIVCRRNGFWYDASERLISRGDALALMGARKNFFIKQAEASYGGSGVRHIADGSEMSCILEAIDSHSKDIVVQESLEQSAALAVLNQSSINTVRLLSFLTADGDVKIYSVILRMGVGGAKVDNASSGGITVGVNGDGCLKPIAFNNCGAHFDEHPTSGVKFDTVRIPNFDKICALVRREARRMPHFRLVSWDIAVEQDDMPTLIEANLCDGELDFHQLNNGPVFGDDLSKILDEISIGK